VITSPIRPRDRQESGIATAGRLTLPKDALRRFTLVRNHDASMASFRPALTEARQHNQPPADRPVNSGPRPCLLDVGFPLSGPQVRTSTSDLIRHARHTQLAYGSPVFAAGGIPIHHRSPTLTDNPSTTARYGASDASRAPLRTPLRDYRISRRSYGQPPALRGWHLVLLRRLQGRRIHIRLRLALVANRHQGSRVPQATDAARPRVGHPSQQVAAAGRATVTAWP
jgi:hypothetical protein